MMYIPTRQAHPTVPSDLPSIQGAAPNTGILHVSLSDFPYIKLNFWITTCSVLPTLHQDFLENDYGLFYFTTFSSKTAWLNLNPRRSITNTIYPQHTEAEPPKTTSYYSMSMMSFSPPHTNPPPTDPVDQMTVIINLMTQQMHKNAVFMEQLQRQ